MVTCGDKNDSLHRVCFKTLHSFVLPSASCVKVASGVIMSQILFFVNITMFDPREAFQVVNMGFYIVTLHIFARERMFQDF